MSYEAFSNVIKMTEIDILDDLQNYINSIVLVDEGIKYSCGYYNALTDVSLYIDKIRTTNEQNSSR